MPAECPPRYTFSPIFHGMDFLWLLPLLAGCTGRASSEFRADAVPRQATADGNLRHIGAKLRFWARSQAYRLLRGASGCSRWAFPQALVGLLLPKAPSVQQKRLRAIPGRQGLTASPAGSLPESSLIQLLGELGADALDAEALVSSLGECTVREASRRMFDKMAAATCGPTAAPRKSKRNCCRSASAAKPYSAGTPSSRGSISTV